MVETELRRDPITGRSVVIDRSPYPHPSDFVLEPLHADVASAGNVASGFSRTTPTCPFCEGKEADAGAELLAWRDGGVAGEPGWSVRVVANRRPMLRIEAHQERRSDGVFEVRDGLGAHEVVIESPVHDQRLQDLPADRLWRVLWAWRTRLQDLQRDTRFASAIVFKNHGRAAGARMDHSHSQIAAYPILPEALDAKVRGAAAHFGWTGRCIFCDVTAQELQDGRRMVSDALEVIAIAPFASRVPFETWVLPRVHSPRFEEASDATIEATAVVLKDVLSRVDWALERPAYNLVLHTAPFSGEADPAFHWHLEVIPRVTRWSGLEWGSGVPRNPVSPEEAARVLRDVRPGG
ncbi:MAG: galactose-1-phosphate uridylyltransferase [Acidobacteriota bacterium]|nr:galactose-1-phosphate uridylyltransferase [Acidobacteriota bacterium]